MKKMLNFALIAWLYSLSASLALSQEATPPSNICDARKEINSRGKSTYTNIIYNTFFGKAGC